MAVTIPDDGIIIADPGAIEAGWLSALLAGTEWPIFTATMNLANWMRPASLGLLLGAMMGFLLAQLGFVEVVGEFGQTGFIATFMVVGAVIGLRKKPLQWLAAANELLLAAYFVVALTPLAGALSRGRVRSDPVRSPVDAVVVLSSGILPNGAMEVHGMDRILSGVELINKRLSGHLVTTRVTYRRGRTVFTSDEEQQRFVAFASPAPRWDVIDSVFSTRDEATGTAALLVPAGLIRIAVVTSPMHTSRACGAFEKVGFVVTCVPAREHAAVTIDPPRADDRLVAFREILYELLGTVKYKAKGWMA
jgi:uncharacterized SAM-binding protein YcdF (DUF218 family)